MVGKIAWTGQFEDLAEGCFLLHGPDACTCANIKDLLRVLADGRVEELVVHGKEEHLVAE